MEPEEGFLCHMQALRKEGVEASVERRHSGEENHSVRQPVREKVLVRSVCCCLSAFISHTTPSR